MNPDLLLMDEPYGQMDIKMRFFLEDEVIKLWKATGATVLFITHNLEEAVYLAERVLVLSAKPATIKAQVPINIERPRKVSRSGFHRSEKADHRYDQMVVTSPGMLRLREARSNKIERKGVFVWIPD